MADSTSNLDLVTSASAAKEAKFNALADAESPAALFGRRASASSLLTWGYYGGKMMIAGVPTAVANGIVTLTALTTNYLYSNGDGTVTLTTTIPTGWPGPLDGNKRALYTIVVGATTATSWTDHRTMVAYGTDAPRIGTVTYASSVTLDWSKYDVIRITLTGACAFTHSGANDGEIKTLEITQDATGSRTATWPSPARFSTTIPSPTLTTTASKMDRLVWQRSATKYDLIQINKAY